LLIFVFEEAEEAKIWWNPQVKHQIKSLTLSELVARFASPGPTSIQLDEVRPNHIESNTEIIPLSFMLYD